MHYDEAVKQVQETKSKSNFMIVEFAYGFKAVLPNKQATELLTALNSAEQLDDDWNEPGRIVPVEDSKISAKPLSREQYEDYKVAMLLNVKTEDMTKQRLQSYKLKENNG